MFEHFVRTKPVISLLNRTDSSSILFELPFLLLKRTFHLLYVFVISYFIIITITNLFISGIDCIDFCRFYAVIYFRTGFVVVSLYAVIFVWVFHLFVWLHISIFETTIYFPSRICSHYINVLWMDYTFIYAAPYFKHPIMLCLFMLSCFFEYLIYLC